MSSNLDIEIKAQAGKAEGELDKVNGELTSLTNPVNKLTFVTEMMNQAQYLHGEINGINLIRESLLHDFALKSIYHK